MTIADFFHAHQFLAFCAIVACVPLFAIACWIMDAVFGQFLYFGSVIIRGWPNARSQSVQPFVFGVLVGVVIIRAISFVIGGAW